MLGRYRPIKWEDKTVVSEKTSRIQTLDVLAVRDALPLSNNCSQSWAQNNLVLYFKNAELKKEMK